MTNWMNEFCDISSNVLPINSKFELKLKPIMTISTCIFKIQKLVNISNIIVNYSQVVQAYQKIIKVWQNESIILMVIISSWFNFFSKCVQIPFLIHPFPKGLFVVPSSVSFLYILLFIYLYASDHKQWGNGAFSTCHYYTWAIQLFFS